MSLISESKIAFAPPQRFESVNQFGTTSQVIYSSSYFEKLSQYGARIETGGAVGSPGTSQAIYSVPTGYTLYITGCSIAFSSDSNIRYAWLNHGKIASPSNYEFLKVVCSGVGAGAANMRSINATQIFPIPLIVDEGNSVFICKAASAGTEEAQANITGFLIPNSVKSLPI